MTIQVRTGYIAGVRGLVVTPLLATGAIPTTPTRLGIRTTQSVGIEREYIEGERITQRGGDVIQAQREGRDVLVGINLTIRDARMDARAAAIMGGGKVITETVNLTVNIVGYDAPMLAEQALQLPYMIEVFAENYQGQSVLQGYIRVTFPLCTGRIPNLSFTDNEWASPEFEIRVKENALLEIPVMRWELVDALPAELI